MEDCIKLDAIVNALGLAGMTESDTERIVTRAQQIQELPEGQSYLRVEQLVPTDFGKTVKLLPYKADEYVTGRLSDVINDSEIIGNSMIAVVIDGKFYSARYYDVVLIDHWSQNQGDYVLRV